LLLLPYVLCGCCCLMPRALCLPSWCAPSPSPRERGHTPCCGLSSHKYHRLATAEQGQGETKGLRRSAAREKATICWPLRAKEIEFAFAPRGASSASGGVSAATAASRGQLAAGCAQLHWRLCVQLNGARLNLLWGPRTMRPRPKERGASACLALLERPDAGQKRRTSGLFARCAGAADHQNVVEKGARCGGAGTPRCTWCGVISYRAHLPGAPVCM
jgi:hypothetical protein